MTDEAPKEEQVKDSGLGKGILIAVLLWIVYQMGTWHGASEERSKRGLFPRLFGVPTEKTPYQSPDEIEDERGPIRRFFDVTQLPVEVQEMHRLHDNALGFSRHIDVDLCEIAQKHAKEMSIIGLSHMWFKNRVEGFGPKSAGENVAFGYTVKGVFDGFMRSERHRENILNKAYDTVGYGMHKRGNRYFWVVIFIESQSESLESSEFSVVFQGELND